MAWDKKTTINVQDSTQTDTIWTWKGTSGTIQDVIDYINTTYSVSITQLKDSTHWLLDNSEDVWYYFDLRTYTVWDATTWIHIWANEVSEIYVWEWIDSYKAMQWPCPSGFHIPMWSEFVKLYNIYSESFDLGGTDSKTYLKLPFAWRRDLYGDEISGYDGYYWSCTAQWTRNAYFLQTGSRTFDTNNERRGLAFPIRPFKDIPVVPDSSWTTLYQPDNHVWGQWIYHNATLWLITIVNRQYSQMQYITIADKNLWATTVYNSGDTLSQANCGNYYQWGNNYWFPFTWTVTTSTTQVDASNYW